MLKSGQRVRNPARKSEVGQLVEKAIVLAVAASLCTATASVCQRRGARSTETAGFDVRLVFRLARQPAWVLGIASMILGFVFQLTALHFGGLALVQPILAAELLFVFGYLAVAGSRRVRRRDWLAAAAMSAGIGLFLRLESPAGGRLHAPGSSWLLAGLVTAGVVSAALAVACRLGHRPGASGSRRAAVLGAVTGISWGFMAAVIKELSSHIDDGIGAIFGTWSLYVLIAAGAATMLLASHALAAGPLAASQPGFTILDPFSASLLGVFLFGEHIRTGVTDLVGETLALGVVVVGAVVLSRSSPGPAGQADGTLPHPARVTAGRAATATPASTTSRAQNGPPDSRVGRPVIVGHKLPEVSGVLGVVAIPAAELLYPAGRVEDARLPGVERVACR
jgi:drug/metabolite transporter (DMT)-like permease